MKLKLVRLAALVVACVVIVGLPVVLVAAQAEIGEAEPAEEVKTVAEVHNDVELLQADIEMVRKDIIENSVEMTAEESEAFWPVYDEFQRNLRVVRGRQAALLADYFVNYDTISDEKARDMLDELFSIKESDARVKKAYISKFMDVLPARKVVRLYQVDNRLDTALEFELTGDIPLMW